MKSIIWKPDKSKEIEANPHRGMGLDALAWLIQADGFLDIFTRPGYPDQGAFVVPLGEQIWCVPFRETETEIVLITAWPDRKLKRNYHGSQS